MTSELGQRFDVHDHRARRGAANCSARDDDSRPVDVPRPCSIADDDPDLVALVARRLSQGRLRRDHRLATARRRCRWREELLPDLAVLDVMMPKLTGLDVTRRLRENPETRDILVMLISAGFENNDIWGLPAGADDYVKKPFGPQELPEPRPGRARPMIDLRRQIRRGTSATTRSDTVTSVVVVDDDPDIRALVAMKLVERRLRR